MGNVRINTSIGTISKVFPKKITVEVNDPSQLSYIHQGGFYELEGINHYITIHRNEDEKFIYNVNGIYVDEQPLLKEEESKFKEKIMIDAIPVGELYFGDFTFGVARTPMVGNDVYLTTNKDFDKALGANQRGDLTFQIGSLSNNEGIMPELSINELFSNHTCVLGNTGSGKSTSVRKLISELSFMMERRVINPASVNFFVFDLHDEYTEDIANKYVKEFNVMESFSVDTKELVLEDWINLVQPGYQIQRPMLIKALKMGGVLDNVEEMDWLYAYIALETYSNIQSDATSTRRKVIKILENVNDEELHEILKKYNSQFGNFRDEDERDLKARLKDIISEGSDVGSAEVGEELDRLMDQYAGRIKQVNSLQTGLEWKK